MNWSSEYARMICIRLYLGIFVLFSYFALYLGMKILGIVFALFSLIPLISVLFEVDRYIVKRIK